MGRKDTALRQYLEDETRFADLINGMLGRGKRLVSEESLRQQDSWVTDSLPLTGCKNRKVHTGKYKKILPKYRDLVRKAAFGINFVVIGIENQDKVHYLMPVRCMGYDVREYERQALKIGRKLLDGFREKKISLSEAEYLSRFRKEDRLHPCITLVLYFGEEWDGAVRMSQLLEDRDIPDELKPYINDYQIHLLPVKKLQDTTMFQSDLRLVLDGIRFADDKEKFRRHVLENPEFQNLDDEAYYVIQQYTHSEELEQFEQEIQIKNQGGNINMCKAITELIAEGREEGREEGKCDLIRTMYHKGMSKELLIEMASLSETELDRILCGENAIMLI